MRENELATLILDSCFQIHRVLGSGLFESVYEEALAYELRERQIAFQRQVNIPVRYGRTTLGIGFRADFIVDKLVIVELKSVEALAPIHKKQLLNYLRLMDLRLGLLINFNVPLLRSGIVRIANHL